MVTILDVAKFLGMSIFDVGESKNILEKIIDSFKDNIITPVVSSFSANINDVITTWITNNFSTLTASLSSAIAAIPTTVTQNWLTSLMDTLLTDITTWFTSHSAELVNVPIATKNLLLNLFINPLIKKFNFLNPPDAPYKLYYDSLDEVKVDTDSLFADGYFHIAWIFYDIVRRVYGAIFTVISESTEWFNDHVAGNNIDFPIPLFSGKAIKIATKVGEVWEPNPDLVIPYIAKEDFAEVYEKYPWLDVFPFNVQLADAKLFENDLLQHDENVDSWVSAPGYYRSDLCYDIIATIMIALVTYVMVKIGWGRHVDKMTRKMNKALELNAQGKFLYNDIRVKNSNNKALLYILMLLTRGSSTNANTINVGLGNIQGLEDVFEDLSVVADDDSVELEIKTIVNDALERIKKLYAGSYT